MPDIAQGVIEAALAKQPGTGGEKMHVDEENGQPAKTRYRVVERAGNRAAWLELEPLTGRTHQLRVHCAAMGHPIVGEENGGQDAFLTGSISRKMHLHARRLIISGPDGEKIGATAELPEHFAGSMEQLGFDPGLSDASPTPEEAPERSKAEKKQAAPPMPSSIARPGAATAQPQDLEAGQVRPRQAGSPGLMHPDPQFRSDDRALLEALIDQVGFGMVFLTTPDGPRVAHTPIVSTGNGAIQFHLSRGNALTRHLDGANALAVVNGPDAYVSPRWYEQRDTVPTWTTSRWSWRPGAEPEGRKRCCTTDRAARGAPRRGSMAGRRSLGQELAQAFRRDRRLELESSPGVRPQAVAIQARCGARHNRGGTGGERLARARPIDATGERKTWSTTRLAIFDCDGIVDGQASICEAMEAGFAPPTSCPRTATPSAGW